MDKIKLPRTTLPSASPTSSFLASLRDHWRRLVWLAGAILLIVAAGLYWFWPFHRNATDYVASPAGKGDVVRAIVATGTVNPVVTVQVGTYVSGPILEIHCDFNTRVKAGQLCAKIDPRTYDVQVAQNAANVASAQAQLNKDKAHQIYTKLDYERNLSLLTQGVVSQDAVDAAKTAYDGDMAQLAYDEALIRQRQAELKAAQVNLGYTNIISPVDGTVVARNVDVGQTVAASFQTPTLFLIARDLTKMQVDTNVSESDIGGAKVGQRATFTVEAFPGRSFEGEVVQVRQAPTTVQNVVTYDVVVGVDNPDLLLKPGMTAMTRIVTEARRDVLRVPSQALRYMPRREARRPTTDKQFSADRELPGRLWILREGKPVAVSVVPGLDDGTNVEIAGGDLHPGDAVIVKEAVTGGGSNAVRPPRMMF